MDETLTTNAVEPTVIEGANTADVNTAGYMQVQGTDINDGSQVIESSTPMDNNVTYNNVPDTAPQFDSGKDFTQNILQQAVQSSHNSNLDANSGTAMDQFLNQDYSYDHNEAGTYWVAGAINDVDTQMSFLNTLIREDMYDEMDLQKYYYDTTMATARAYASQKKKETAYGFYRAAQEKAIAEAQLTGWYMPAEGNYMLGQYTVAQNVLEDPDAPDDAKARAQRISGTVEKWFKANQIGTRGIKCLNMMNYEENVRHNTIMGELQAEANKISGSSAGASAALAAIQLREFKFQVEELENQYGWNFTKEIGINNDDYLGHDVANDPEYTKYQSLTGAKNLTELLKNPNSFAAILGARNTQWLKDSLGEENYKNLYNGYLADLGNKGLEESIKNNGNVLDDSYLNKETYKVSASDKEYGSYKDKNVYTFHTTENGKPVTKCYVKDNNDVYHQIDSTSIKLQDGSTLADKVDNFSNTTLTRNGEEIQVGKMYSTGSQAASVTSDWKSYGVMTEGRNDDKKNSHAKKVEEYEAKGYIWMSSKHGDSGMFDIDSGTVMYNPEKDEWITISDIQNKVETKKASDIKEVSQPKWKVGNTFNGTDYDYMKSNSLLLGETTIKNSYGKDVTTKAYMFVDGDGNPHYYMLGQQGSDEVLTNTYTIISEKEALKINPNATSKVDDINNYRANIKAVSKTTKAGKNQDTMALEQAEQNKNANVELNTPSGGGSSSPASVKETKSETSSQERAEYEEYLLRMKDEPKADILPFEEWVKNRPTINDVKVV